MLCSNGEGRLRNERHCLRRRLRYSEIVENNVSDVTHLSEPTVPIGAPGKRGGRSATRPKVDIISARMDYHYCGVVEMRGVHDQEGTLCGRYANALCYDCGASLCSRHAESCDLCGVAFCLSCLSFHQSQHSKPAQSDQGTDFPKKKTA
jgi:hypothetical protein